MEKYDIIRLIYADELLMKNGINANALGIVIGCDFQKASVMLLNEQNFGNYAFYTLDTNTLKIVDRLPLSQRAEFDEFITSVDFAKYKTFNTPPFKEYDCVVLIKDKPKYTQVGVHKGDIGCVISSYAIGNKIEVDFTKVDENGDISGAVFIVSCDDIALKE